MKKNLIYNKKINKLLRIIYMSLKPQFNKNNKTICLYNKIKFKINRINHLKFPIKYNKPYNKVC